MNDDLQLDNIDPICSKSHPKKYSLALQIPYVICYASTEFVLKQQLSLQATQWQNASVQNCHNQRYRTFCISSVKINSESESITIKI